MADEKSINIELNDSLFAHGFDNDHQIHQENMSRAMDLIREQLKQIDIQKCRGNGKDQDVFLSHFYRTIGVFGDRGSGKTSFMISLLNKCKEELTDEVEVLRMIDPTLVEHKKPIILCIISLIQQKVEQELRKGECSSGGEVYGKRRNWDKKLSQISQGLFAVEEVGRGYDDSLWKDETYVLHSGLARINDANEFEAYLREMTEEALNILGKEAFVVAFDDIDVDVKQGWNVLESLRRYLSDSRIISIVSGNIKLYGSLVRNEMAKELGMPEGVTRELMINELESQYMLKLLNPSNRINLLSLGQLVHNPGTTVMVKTETEVKGLEEQYKEILKKFGIADASSQNTFKDFLLSMSLRSQIHFLKDACTNEENTPLPLDVFTSRLYAHGIDIGALRANIRMMNITLLEYLNTKTNLPDCYLLLPTLSDKDVNSNFMALTLLECWYLRTVPFLAFDYMLRIGYLRNVTLPLETSEITKRFCKYAGWNQLMSLKNNVGLTMAYARGKNLGDLKEHIAIYGLGEIAKQGTDKQRNALDSVLKEEEDSFVKLITMFPFIRITHSKNNESRSYYSLVVLLAVVGDMLRCEDENGMVGLINDLKLFRSYQAPQDESNSGNEHIDGKDFGVETGQEEATKLATLMCTWKNNYQDCMLPPYALGRIMTRVYTSLPNVEESSVGGVMNIMVANFFNACLIEEARVRITAGEQGKINNSNMRSDIRIFKNNLGKKEIIESLSFTQWVVSCPMLNCFLDGDTYNEVQNAVAGKYKNGERRYPVYELLCRINSKSNRTTEDVAPDVEKINDRRDEN